MIVASAASAARSPFEYLGLNSPVDALPCERSWVERVERARAVIGDPGASERALLALPMTDPFVFAGLARRAEMPRAVRTALWRAAERPAELTRYIGVMCPSPSRVDLSGALWWSLCMQLPWLTPWRLVRLARAARRVDLFDPSWSAGSDMFPSSDRTRWAVRQLLASPHASQQALAWVLGWSAAPAGGSLACVGRPGFRSLVSELASEGHPVCALMALVQRQTLPVQWGLETVRDFAACGADLDRLPASAQVVLPRLAAGWAGTWDQLLRTAASITA